MTAAGRQDAAGGAAALQLFNTITDPNATTCQVTGTTSGWVFAGNFTICLDANEASEEKILCSGITGSGPSTITFLERGYDGTTPTTHQVGANVTHVLPATVVMDVERHLYDTSEDDHTQYLTTARHASPANHEFGTPAGSFAFGAGATPPAAVGTAADPGSGANPARDDHVHSIGTGAVDVFAMVDSTLLGLAGDVSSIDNGDTAAAGTASKFARADHQHAFTPVAVKGPQSAAGTGVSTLTYSQIAGLAGADLWAGRTVWQTDTGSLRPWAGMYIYNGSAWVGDAQTQPWASFTSASTNADGDGAVNTFNWSTVEDPLSLLTSASTVTIPTGGAGVWTFEAGVSWGASSTGARVVRVVGSTFGNRRLGAAFGTTGAMVAGSLSVRCVDGETVHVERVQTSGVTLALQPIDGTHYFSVRRVHA